MLMFTTIGLSSIFKVGELGMIIILRIALFSRAIGLSAVATNNSGYMFIGAIGYTYATGLLQFG